MLHRLFIYCSSLGVSVVDLVRTNGAFTVVSMQSLCGRFAGWLYFHSVNSSRGEEFPARETVCVSIAPFVISLLGKELSCLVEDFC